MIYIDGNGNYNCLSNKPMPLVLPTKFRIVNFNGIKTIRLGSFFQTYLSKEELEEMLELLNKKELNNKKN